eukprot:2939437-Rhodomonas_salina.1
MRCPPSIVLTRSLRTSHTMSITDIWYLPLHSYAMCGTDTGYAATRPTLRLLAEPTGTETLDPRP